MVQRILCRKIKEIDEREKTDKIIVLGDLYYHGPRNELSQEYKPNESSRNIKLI